ncbi:hypothetical protein MXB_1481, partial [Myxobolus squamalis]
IRFLLSTTGSENPYRLFQENLAILQLFYIPVGAQTGALMSLSLQGSGVVKGTKNTPYLLPL